MAHYAAINVCHLIYTPQSMQIYSTNEERTKKNQFAASFIITTYSSEDMNVQSDFDDLMNISSMNLIKKNGFYKRKEWGKKSYSDLSTKDSNNKHTCALNILANLSWSKDTTIRYFGQIFKANEHMKHTENCTEWEKQHENKSLLQN